MHPWFPSRFPCVLTSRSSLDNSQRTVCSTSALFAMEFVSLVSGGKDGIYNTLECLRLGLTLRCFANLYPPPAHGGDELDSFMFQSVGHTAIEALAECAGVPLIRRSTSGRSTNHGLLYSAAALAAASHVESAAGRAEQEDEIAALHALLADVCERFPGVRGVACGAILSTYQRGRVEAVCRALGLTPLALLWQREQAGLLADMIRAPVDAVLVKVASLGLSLSMLGGRIADLQPRLHTLAASAGLNECGEGGEYESLVLDAPFFVRRLRLVDVERVVISRDAIAPVAHLCVRACATEDREGGDIGRRAEALYDAPSPLGAAPATAAAAALAVLEDVSTGPAPASDAWLRSWLGTLRACAQDAGSKRVAPDLPRWPVLRPGLPTIDGGAGEDPAAAEMTAVLESLQLALRGRGCGLNDVVFVHLFLADMASFAAVNAAYCTFFGEFPPSRSCVQVETGCRDDSVAATGASVAGSPGNALVFVGGLSAGPLVRLDCVAVRGSGAALAASALAEEGAPAASAPPPRRSVLHVASLSRWAPLCLGPYSQANCAARLAWCAGQIGLRPETMRFVVPTPPPGATLPGGATRSASALALRAAAAAQLHQACLNTARVLAAVGSALPRALSLVVYVSDALLRCGRGGGGEDEGEGLEGLLLADVLAGACAWLAGVPAGVPAAESGGADGDSSDEDGSGVEERGPSSAAAPAGDVLEERSFSLGEGARDRPPYLRISSRPSAAPKDDSPLLVGPADAYTSAPVLSRVGRSLGLGDCPPRVALKLLAAQLPLRVVVVPRLPRDASVEVEALCVLEPSAPVRLAAGGDGSPSAARWACHWVADGSAASLWVDAPVGGGGRGGGSEEDTLAAAAAQQCGAAADHAAALLNAAGAADRVASACVYYATGQPGDGAAAAAAAAEAVRAALSRRQPPVECAVTLVPVVRIPALGEGGAVEDSRVACHVLLAAAGGEA